MGIGEPAMEGLVVNPQFWRDKRVLLTGHTGFKGSWLALWLQQLGANVVGMALPAGTVPNLFQLASVAKGMDSFSCDVRDPDHVARVVRAANPEIVIHMAAQALVRYGYQYPIETYATNVMGTVHLLDALRDCSDLRAVISVTSDKCYDNKEWAWGYRENEPLGGHDPYSSSKAAAELVTSAFNTSYFAERKIGIASARAGNVVGGGDWAADRLVPDIIQSFSAGKPVRIRRPLAVRPWQHVLEPLSGYLLLAEKMYGNPADFAGAWNFGPQEADAQPVQWVVEQLAAAWGAGAQWEADNGSHPHEAHYLKLDISKAKSQLQWQPNWTLARTLAYTVDWYKNCNQGGDVRQLTLEQIAAYQSEIALC